MICDTTARRGSSRASISTKAPAARVGAAGGDPSEGLSQAAATRSRAAAAAQHSVASRRGAQSGGGQLVESVAVAELGEGAQHTRPVHLELPAAAHLAVG